MSTSRNPQPEKTYFEQQRELVLQDVATNLEQVLQNMNTLNRSLESVIAVRLPQLPLLEYLDARRPPARRPYAARVGNEFGQVEGLWSMFENVMAQQQQSNNTQEEEGQTQGGGQDQGDR
ncbi:hypothetical protein D6C84_09899 [Aureobasidium pullulans]|uniref:DASH complex subunit DAD1 n=1 Tax=Aureobasidium pullulans TaxID=5580 RepID=A0A4S9X275_AURPU|nr:hypothetical protein D6C84_09899 [Aureobasidium pullulans]